MTKIYKNEHGYYILTTTGAMVYLPECMNNQEAVDFITDYFVQIKL